MHLITSEHDRLHIGLTYKNPFVPLQHYVLVKCTKLERLFNFSTAEVKLLMLLCYFVVIFFIYFVIFAVIGTEYYLSIFDYLHCELGGYDPNNPCDDSVLFQPASVSLVVFTLVLNVTAPFMHLLFVVNVQELKEMCKKCTSKI